MTSAPPRAEAPTAPAVARRPVHASRSLPGRRRAVPLVVALILTLALALRLFGLDWDQRALFHPDERQILMLVNDLHLPQWDRLGDLFSPQSPLNPAWFNYGSLPLYMLKAVQIAASPVVDWDIWDLRIPGRVMSAVFDTATVGLVFVIGARWYGARVGLLGAGLAALAVLHIQLSHYFAVDPILTFFIVATIFFLARVAHGGRRGDSVLAGIMLGFALATKVSVAPLALSAVVAHLLYAVSREAEALRPVSDVSVESLERRWRGVSGLLVCGASALFALLLTQPYMLIDYAVFIGHVAEQSEMVRGVRDYPYTRQYIDTAPYWYHISQLALWGLGPVAGVVAWAGLAWAGVAASIERRKSDIVILSWVVPYLLITGWFDVKFMRYMLPVTPFLLIFGARLVWWAGDRLRAIDPLRLRHAGPVLAAVILGLTAHYAFAFTSIYADPHPGHGVSVYLNENAVAGSTILKEHWEEGIPGLGDYRVQELSLYDADTDAKFQRITESLAGGDYLVLYSNRLYATIPRLPERYPVSTAYYERLFDGDLGYELVHVSQKAPSALGVMYDSDPFARIDIGPPAGYQPLRGTLLTLGWGWADESFTVYDHPKSMVFENTGRLSADEIRQRIGVAAPPPAAAQPGLMMSEEQTQIQQSGGRWTGIVYLERLPNSAAWVVWLAAVQLIALAALPLGFIVFRALPDRGYLPIKALGLLLVSFGAWLAASSGLALFSGWLVLASTGILGIFSALAWRWRRSEMALFFRARWRLVAGMEALFLVAFVAFLLIRLANPDLWHPFRGGEKPMDFAYLNAVIRSSIMPPYDPWFSGGYLNYYYFGQFIVAALIRLTGIAPAVAYNLAVPLLFALTVGGAFSIVYNLAEAARRARHAMTSFAWGPVIAGLTGAVLVAVAANVDGLNQAAGGIWRMLQGEPFGRFDYWQSSRMMAPGSPGNEITEFPFFSFLFADLHAHMIAIPFSLLALAVGLAVFLRAGQPGRPTAETWGSLVVLALCVGSLRVINAWDYPTSLLLAAGAVLGGELLSSRRGMPGRMLFGTVKLGVVVVLSHALFLPFHQNFQLFNDGIELSVTQTPLWRYLAIHSIFLFVIVSFVAWQWRQSAALFVNGGLLRVDGILRPLGLTGEQPVPIRIDYVLVAAVPLAALLAMMAVLGFATVVFTVLLAGAVALLAGAWLASCRPDLRPMLAVGAMIVIALMLGAGVDLVTVKGDIGRMNTVFKFYLQAWVLMGLASAFGLWAMWTAGFFSLRALTPGRGAWLGILAALAIAVLIYPFLGTQARLSDRFETFGMGIDGMAFMEHAVHSERGGQLTLRHDLEAIRWMQRHVDGSPVIAEGIAPLYHWGNRVSVYTGLPAVIGWEWHQVQQRMEYHGAIVQRRRDIEHLYSTPVEQEAMNILTRYNVSYVYVGELEKLYYPWEGLAKFETMAGLDLVYANDQVSIYKTRLD